MTEEESMREYLQGKDVGREQTLAEVRKLVLDEASIYFCAGMDEKARLLRELANKIPSK